MRTRLDFDRYLKDIVGKGANVYFQPPSNVSGAGQKVIKNIKYPAIFDRQIIKIIVLIKNTQ